MYSQKQIARALQESWDVDTAYPDGTWTPKNPARAQCVVSSLVVQYLLGGDLEKFIGEYDGASESHYANILPDGQKFDTTRTQYPPNAILTPASINLHGYHNVRDKMMHEPDTKQRYELLLSRVEQHLNQEA